MTNFEFQRFITIGQYLPTGSRIHRLDPRTRLFAGGVLLVAITAATDVLGVGVALLWVFLLLSLARIPLHHALRGLLPPLPFIVFLALLQVLFGPPVDNAWLVWGMVRISAVSVLAALLLLLRFAVLILTISLMSFCLSISDIVVGLAHLLRPLSALGLPTQDFVLMVQVALRFLPLLAREAERIAKAQASRGADWGTGRGGVLRRARQALPILLPLFLTALQRAETMAVAMDARAYRSKERASMRELQFGFADGFALGVVVIAALLIVFV